MEVTAGAEPADFKFHFHAWDDSSNYEIDDFGVARLRAENPAPAADGTCLGR
jgi:hypothetical protein